jgi:hypothetical protein
MTNLNEIIIIGGGNSIKKGLSIGLRERLIGKCVITCNYAYKHFDHTFLAFCDRNFYKPQDSNNPDIYEELKTLPLIVGINDNGIEEFKLDNTILLDKKYRVNLTGMFALRLATMLMEEGTIYLLGFDWDRRTGLPERDSKYNPYSDNTIHYYDDIKHRGMGYVGYYENHNPDKEFLEFTKKETFKIYNVSLESNIRSFEKISYDQFFRLMSKKIYNQEELRQEIKEQLSNLIF